MAVDAHEMGQGGDEAPREFILVTGALTEGVVETNFDIDPEVRNELTKLGFTVTRLALQA